MDKKYIRTILVCFAISIIYSVIMSLVPTTSAEATISIFDNFNFILYKSSYLAGAYIFSIGISYLISYGMGKKIFSRDFEEWGLFHLSFIFFLAFQSYILTFLSQYFERYSTFYPYSLKVADGLSAIGGGFIFSLIVLSIRFFIRTVKEKSNLRYFYLKQAIVFLLIFIFISFVGSVNFS